MTAADPIGKADDGVDPPVPIRAATDGDQAAAVALWTACGLVVPHNDPHEDFRAAQAGGNAAVLIAGSDGLVAGTVVVGHDAHRGWLYYLAVAPDRRSGGVGRALIDAANAWLRDRAIRKVQLLVRSGNAGVVGFYEAVGFERSDVIVMQRWLVDPGPSHVPPAR